MVRGLRIFLLFVVSFGREGVAPAAGGGRRDSLLLNDVKLTDFSTRTQQRKIHYYQVKIGDDRSTRLI